MTEDHELVRCGRKRLYDNIPAFT